MTQNSPTLLDHPAGYGPVSRALHWLMAVLFAWQFVSAILHALAGDLPLARFFWSYHASVGVLLFGAIFLRGAWGLLNLRRRPAHGDGLAGLGARLGHIALYGLMLAVPTLAVLRSIGSGRGLQAFGVQLVAAGGERIDGLVALGHALHGLLGWALLVLTLGHIAMALVHTYVWREDILSRMTRGRAPAR